MDYDQNKIYAQQGLKFDEIIQIYDTKLINGGSDEVSGIV
jgi:hypothetical protein